ncbi:MAG: hypothetical protein J0M22_12145 [Gammaproteobacteria bacterium]|nr:hypothetical protein [Gammaproteobacteria bacterium]
MKAKILSAALVGLSFVASTAHAALDAAVVTSVKDGVIADAGTAVTAGFGVMAVVLGASVGMSLLGRFISKGANGG